MQRAKNPTGDAPHGVTEYALGSLPHVGSLPHGARFVLYGTTRALDMTGTLEHSHPCGCTVRLDRPIITQFEATDQLTGEAHTVAIRRNSSRTRMAWATPVGLAEPLPDPHVDKSPDPLADDSDDDPLCFPVFDLDGTGQDAEWD